MHFSQSAQNHSAQFSQRPQSSYPLPQNRAQFVQAFSSHQTQIQSLHSTQVLQFLQYMAAQSLHFPHSTQTLSAHSEQPCSQLYSFAQSPQWLLFGQSVKQSLHLPQPGQLILVQFEHFLQPGQISSQQFPQTSRQPSQTVVHSRQPLPQIQYWSSRHLPQ